jgi:glycerol-3-phosphate dehydrogenase (NAD(P)+)
MSNICVLGDGAWGRALAGLATDCGHDVTIWSRKHADTSQLKKTDAIIVALPAQAVASVLPTLGIDPLQALIITAKGIDRNTNTFMYEVARSISDKHVCMVLSGPSFAEDVSRKLPTAVTLASANLAVAREWAKSLSRPYFRIYASDDPLGVCIGGSLKNILAIACGIADGKQLGASAKAALTTRGFSELMRLGKALGAKPETLMGLSGLGDLLLTCSSPQSRNYAFGKRLGEGQTIKQALAVSGGVVEGVYSARAALQLAIQHTITMPITQAVNAIVENGANPDDMIEALLARPVGAEFL